MKSIRGLDQIQKLNIQYQKKERIRWDSWDIKACVQILDDCSDYGWVVKNKKDLKESFEKLSIFLAKNLSNKYSVVKNMINKYQDFKFFLYIHSVFDIYSDGSDWLVNAVKDSLTIDKDEFENYINSRKIPKSVLDKFKMFNPEVILFDFYPIKISWGYFQRDSNDRVVDPIMVIDKSYLGTKIDGTKNYYTAETFIRKYDPIDLKTWKPKEDEMTWEKFKKIRDEN